MRFRGRSYIAFVLTPEAPIFDWLADLDAWTRRSTGFFVGKPVVLDLSAVNLSKDAIAHLVAELLERKPDYTAAFARQQFFFCNDSAFLDRFVAGLRTAGIPAGTA